MTDKKKTIKAWAIEDVKKDKITFVTLRYGDWYIAKSLRKDFKVIPVKITYAKR